MLIELVRHLPAWIPKPVASRQERAAGREDKLLEILLRKCPFFHKTWVPLAEAVRVGCLKSVFERWGGYFQTNLTNPIPIRVFLQILSISCLSIISFRPRAVTPFLPHYGCLFQKLQEHCGTVNEVACHRGHSSSDVTDSRAGDPVVFHPHRDCKQKLKGAFPWLLTGSHPRALEALFRQPGCSMTLVSWSGSVTSRNMRLSSLLLCFAICFVKFLIKVN